MSIAGINSVNYANAPSSQVPDSDALVSLASRMSAEQSEVANPTPGGTKSIYDEDLQSIYDWMMANKITMTENPKKMVNDMLAKIRAFRSADGSRTYGNYMDINSFCVLLKDKADSLETTDVKFFNQLSDTIFALNVCFENMKNDIFIRPTATYDEPYNLD
jgi:hypothetical protein